MKQDNSEKNKKTKQYLYTLKDSNNKKFYKPKFDFF
jgi:hypothetical protein